MIHTIGILGGGQLGRMMAMAAAEMGYRVHIYCPEADAPASEVAALTTTAAYEDLKALRAFAESVDVITYEFENIPAASVALIMEHVAVRPGADLLQVSQHRVLEKQAINKLGIATAPFAAVQSLAELKTAVQAIGLPAVLKTCRMGYDGKGQAILRETADVEKAWKQVTGDGCRVPEEKPSLSDTRHPSPVTHDLILEAFIPFRMEISVIVARDVNGAMACYCPVQNTHKHHILHETIAPAPISAELSAKAEHMARVIAQGLNLTGLMAIEMFVVPPLIPPAGGGDEGGELLVNETAPRPHNSGHWTMDACVTSQFTQAIRAVCGLPLGSTQRLCDATMLNLIGDDINDWQRYAAMPNAKLHLYGKKEARAGRKMGHVNFLTVTND